MSETATEIMDADLGGWAPSVRLFSTSDDKHFVVDADLFGYPESGSVRFIRRATCVLYCNADGTVTDLTPDHVFPPGTTAEDAVVAMGYLIES